MLFGSHVELNIEHTNFVPVFFSFFRPEFGDRTLSSVIIDAKHLSKTLNRRRNSAFDGNPPAVGGRGIQKANSSRPADVPHLVFECEPTDMVLFVDGEFQEYFADVCGTGFLQRFHRGGVQHGAVVRPKHFDVTMVVQPVDCQRFVKK